MEDCRESASGGASRPAQAARGLVAEIAHPTVGLVRTVASPVRFDDAAPRPYRAPPRLGEHTREILAEAGYRAEQIAARQADGTAGPAPPR